MPGQDRRSPVHRSVRKPGFGGGDQTVWTLRAAFARQFADHELRFGFPWQGEAALGKVEFARDVVPGRVFLGGHSYGGRQATMLATDDPVVAAALLLLSYPLHPPRRPTQLRTAHFPELRVPLLFVTGTRDEFASVEEITSALELIPARTRLLVIEGAGHSLAGRRELPAVAAKVISAFREFIG